MEKYEKKKNQRRDWGSYEQTVHQVEHTADTGNGRAGIFYSGRAFQHRFHQIARHAAEKHQDARNNCNRNTAYYFCLREKVMKTNCQQDGYDQSARGTFPGFTRTDRRNHLVIAAFHQFIAYGTDHICADVADLGQQHKNQKIIVECPAS